VIDKEKVSHLIISIPSKREKSVAGFYQWPILPMEKSRHCRWFHPGTAGQLCRPAVT
jgi:hypothetical protein